jgi:hypothetical protein
MTGDHPEVEYKYALDESTDLPGFGAMPGVKAVSVVDHELVATYFDTPDLALAAAGVTLRRRIGGDDAGWHLKLPTSGGRLEIVLPPGRAVRIPPLALRKVVSGIVRDEGLAPVVVIRTHRRTHRLHGKNGDLLAEVADDRVSAEPVASDAPRLAPLSWREAEVELVTGKLSLLVRASDLMVSVGAQRSASPSKLVQALGERLPRAQSTTWPEPGKKGPAADVIRLRLLTQVAALRQQDPWVRHDAPRVRARPAGDRASAATRPGQLPGLPRHGADRAAARRAGLAGRTPRWTSGRRGAGPAAPGCPRRRTRRPGQGAGASPDRARVPPTPRRGARRAEVGDGLESVLRPGRPSPGTGRRTAWTDDSRKRAGRALSKALDDDWKRLRTLVLSAAGENGRPPEEAGDLHAVRKAAKRVRYAAEALVPLPGKGAKRMVRVHERIQTVLGDQHDEAEAQAALVELADGAAAAGENAFTYGLLHARLEARSAGHAADFDQAWQDSLTARARYRIG